MNEVIRNIFYPKSIGLIGASSKEGSIGYEILKTIDKFNYTGKVFPVNPKANEILGYECFHSISEIRHTIDLAIVMVPKNFILKTLDEIIAKRIKSIVLITAGFKETGKEGEKLEEEVVEKLNSAGIRMVGPNCMGVINTIDGVSLNATFVAEQPLTGKTAFLSQSGALGAMILNSLRDTDIRLSHFISVGNKADLNENDFIQFWEEDDNTDAITLYLESFENGFEFIKPIILNEISKPIIVLKAGKTESGMKAASSHTGALSTHDKICDSILKQFGVIRADNINELFNTAKGLENFEIPKGNRVCVITNAGGPSILLVDQLEREGLDLAELSNETMVELRNIVHPEGSVNNPIDLLPGGNEESYYLAIKTVLQDESVDAVVSLFVEPVMVKPMPIAERINEIDSEKPILQVIMPLPEFWKTYREGSKDHKPIFRNPEDPAEVLNNMLFYKSSLKKRSKHRGSYNDKLSSIGMGKFKSYKGFIDQQNIKEICTHYNIPIVEQSLFNVEEVLDQTNIVYPLVIKGISKDLVHKSELDVVKLNIKNRSELEEAVNEISSKFLLNDLKIEKVLVQNYVETKYELLIGGFRDPSFGPVIVFGTGGKYVEVYDDTQIRSAIISDEEILEMINSTKIGKILSGVRGERSLNLDELVSIIRSSAEMIIENDKMNEFDFNPLILDKQDHFYAVDVRIKY